MADVCIPSYAVLFAPKSRTKKKRKEEERERKRDRERDREGGKGERERAKEGGRERARARFWAILSAFGRLFWAFGHSLIITEKIKGAYGSF